MREQIFKGINISTSVYFLPEKHYVLNYGRIVPLFKYEQWRVDQTLVSQ